MSVTSRLLACTLLGWLVTAVGAEVIRMPKPEFKGAVTQEEIIDYLTPLVAKWWLPDEVRFVDEIPKTSVGKFDKKVIREQALKAPAAARPSE